MRKIGEKISQAGFQVEELRCSSDQDSLDGIVVRGQGIALVDGTRPHIIEPRYPGCLDEIINFGEFWDRDAICARQNGIVASIAGDLRAIRPDLSPLGSSLTSSAWTGAHLTISSWTAKGSTRWQKTWRPLFPGCLWLEAE